MAYKLEKLTADKLTAGKEYSFPNGKLAAPQVLIDEYGANRAGTIFATMGTVICGRYDIEILKHSLNINEEFTNEADLISALETAYNARHTPTTPPTTPPTGEGE
jgi:hypothetical protein